MLYDRILCYTIPYALLQADVGSRLRVLRDEAARVAANTKLTEPDKRRIVAEKYGALMAPVISALDKHAREVGVAASTLRYGLFSRP